MAIECVNFVTIDDCIDFLENSGYFSKVEENSGKIQCYIKDDNDNDYMVYSSDWSNSSISYTRFFPKSGIEVMYNCWGPRYGFKTSKGLFLMTSVQEMTPQNQYWTYQIIGKTNNNKMGVAFNYNNSGRFLSAAVGENETSLVTTAMTFRDRIYSGLSQISMAPIGTKPTIGTSYIEGAYLLVMVPYIPPGIIEIDGKKYVTNGVIALEE